MKKRAITRKATRRTKQEFPPGWNERRVQKVIAYYDRQTEDEELAEYEAGMSVDGYSVMMVPRKLVPEVRRLMGRRHGTAAKSGRSANQG